MLRTSVGAPKRMESKSWDAAAWTSPLRHMYAPWASPSLGAWITGMPISVSSSFEVDRMSGVILEVCCALEKAFCISPSLSACSYSSFAFSRLAMRSSMVPALSSLGLPSKTNAGSMPFSIRFAVL